MRHVRSVNLGIISGLVRVTLPLDYVTLRVDLDSAGLLRLTALVDESLPDYRHALYAVNTLEGSEVPLFCGRHLGSIGSLYLFEVDPRSAEAREAHDVITS